MNVDVNQDILLGIDQDRDSVELLEKDPDFLTPGSILNNFIFGDFFLRF